MAKRRGKGEGSIYRRKSDGKWVGTLDLGWVDGKRKRRTIYGRTEQDVRIRLFDIRAARKRGTRVTTPQYRTVGQVLDGWLKSTGNSELRPRTFDSYNMIVSRHLAPKLGHTPIKDLDAQAVRLYIRDKLDIGLSPTTVKNHHAVLRRILNDAVDDRLIAVNAAALVKPPRLTQPDMTILTPEQARSFLEQVRGNRLEALYTVAISMGLRQGEALGLRWEDVDLENATLTIRKSLQRTKQGLELVEPKTAKSRRTLSILR